MTDSLSVDVPCISIPEVPGELSVTLPNGAKLNAFADFSQGIPTDCSISFNMMIQLAPVLASMSCLLAILGVVKALKDVAEGMQTLDFSKVPDLLEAIGKAVPCFVAVQPPSIIFTIKGVLQVIIKFLNCFLDQLESVLNFQANIDLNIAEGNPVLQSTLGCAQDNAELGMEHLMAALGPVQPLLDMVTSLGDFADLSLGLPNMTELSLDGDPTEVIQDVRQAVTTIEQTIEALPG